MVFAIWIILQFSETWGGGQWPDLALAGGGAQYECGEEETIRRKKRKSSLTLKTHFISL